ncbi:molybdenum cofactor biosynthesis protein MoaE [Carboxydochorda subterranea]|uniref:Molybdenum cofactor biosynthesis protein MoaE n=1 Tax=Carboxydichorda subterranea TaxID=3109565 RepID=A0ABZ1BZ44_9FIRM|nr:molybdenum cofactor biosynthesis protein MoaE [Limnochorda sp. L945t]WRP17795.1 molybdenum cofactor biosynthesis protein MoaE [Limnochorda sp. L945t]
MRVTVRLFAALAEKAGRRELVVQLGEEATALDAWDAAQQALGGPMALPRESVRVAVNLRYTGWDHPLRDGDEVALIPPVAGGNGAHGPSLAPPAVEITVTEQPLSVEAAVARVGGPTMGAIAVFVGTVREWTERAPARPRGATDHPAGPAPHGAPSMRRTVAIHYEAYGPMAEKEMESIGREVVQRWPGARVVLAHRLGWLTPGEVSLVIAVATPHRAPAFEAVRWATERLKRDVPIWKKERYEDGEEWVGMGG